MTLPRLASDVGRTLTGYVAGQLQIAGILALIYTAGFGVAGVPGWYVLGPLCGLLQLVPLFGAAIAALLAFGLALFAETAEVAIIGAVITFVTAQALEGFYLTPKILGRRLRMPPIAVFLAVLAGGALFGFFGVLFAAPILAVLLVIWRFSREPR
jgi:predicted PurR-regulated permease PerM